MINTYLKYRTFDELFEDSVIGVPTEANAEQINHLEMIKVARNLNKKLGLRILGNSDVVLEVENGKVRLPYNFHSFSYGFICTNFQWREVPPQGTSMWEIPVPEYHKFVDPKRCCDDTSMLPCGEPCQEDSCVPNICIDKCDNEYVLVQKVNTVYREFKSFLPLSIRPAREVECDCPNIGFPGAVHEARIEDGWLFTNFDDGYVYINYTTNMEDKEGNLLVPDHELINYYYEYAIKEKIFEDLYLKDPARYQAQYQLMSMKRKEHSKTAFAVVRTPNFSEMKKLWEVNRKAQYHKYYNMIGSVTPNGSSKLF